MAVGKIAGRVRFSSATISSEPQWHSFVSFSSRVSAVKKIRRRDSCQNSGKQSCNAGRENKSERERGRAPWRHAVGTGNQLADAALNSAAARFLLHFAMACAADVIHKRRAQNARDSILGNNAAELVGRDAEKREIEQARLFREPIFLDRDAGQRGDAANVKCQHQRVLGEQLFLTFFFLDCLVAVSLD